MVSQFYPPTIGGEERHVKTLSTALAERGHSVAVALFEQAGKPEFEVDEGVRLYRIPSSVRRMKWLFTETERRHAPPFPDPEAMLALRRVIMRERPDIVHAHNWLLHSFLPLKAWSGAKLVVTLHDYSLVCAKKSMVYHRATCAGPELRKCISCAGRHYGNLKGLTTVLSNWAMGTIERSAVDMFITVSLATAVGNHLIRDRLPFQVIPNFLPDLDAGTAEDWAEYVGQLPDQEFMLFVGDLGRFKGVPVLLQAYEKLTNAPPLVLIGRETADTPSTFPANVTVLRSWPHGAVQEAWRRCGIALLPSVGPETFGIVMLEAMAAGRPAIASRIGGLPDIIADGETGLLVPPGDVEALRDAMQTLIDNPELRRQMGAAGRCRVNQFHANEVVPRIEQLYQVVLNEQASDTTGFRTGDGAKPIGSKF